MSVESTLNGINVDNTPKSRRKSLKQNRHREKKLLSEDFDIEENLPDALGKRKFRGKGDNTKLEDRKENEEPNFNTEAYHKKQHKI